MGCTRNRLQVATAWKQAAIPITVLLLVALHQPLATAQTCAWSYQPGSRQQRLKSGLLDSRIGPVRVVNNADHASIISLYHPEAPDRVFKYWLVDAGQSVFLTQDGYTSDWGIQLDDGPVCFLGLVSTWDGSKFTTFPRRLLVADGVPAAKLSAGLSPTTDPVTTEARSPKYYEQLANQQLQEGDRRSSLISLLRAVDLYRAVGRRNDEQRVQQRINQLRGF